RPTRASRAAWNVYWEVADVDAAAARIPGLGGRILTEPMEVPGGGRIVQGVDAQGAMFSLSSHQA
ncbi:MAG: VOC family protein, partial [Chloroflexota bacterium]|nr:VOC family protein [Chloroflexota bacterium]